MTYDQADIFQRQTALIGADAMKRLRHAQIVVCGVGGVGSYVVEALARAGVGALTLIDFDLVAPSNINRQLCALHSTIGQAKVEVMACRIADINPECRLTIYQERINVDNVERLLSDADYIADAIDDVPAKVALIKYAHDNGIPLVSALGAGKRLLPEKLRIADISQTHTCPLARTIRRELRAVGITDGVTVIFSEEMPVEQAGSGVLGSISFVPSVSGLLLASVIVRRLIAEDN